MPITKSGIYHNLKESHYTVSNSEAVFFFSSVVNLNKFLKRYTDHRIDFDRKMKKFTGNTPYNLDTLADIVLYETIEKRGFHCWVKGVVMDWQNMHAYALRKMTEKDTLDWQKTQKPNLQERRKIIRQST